MCENRVGLASLREARVGLCGGKWMFPPIHEKVRVVAAARVSCRRYNYKSMSYANVA